MLREELPKIITPSVPGPKAAALLARRRKAVPDAIGTVYPTVIQRGEGAMLEDADGIIFLIGSAASASSTSATLTQRSYRLSKIRRASISTLWPTS